VTIIGNTIFLFLLFISFGVPATAFLQVAWYTGHWVLGTLGTSYWSLIEWSEGSDTGLANQQQTNYCA